MGIKYLSLGEKPVFWHCRLSPTAVNRFPSVLVLSLIWGRRCLVRKGDVEDDRDLETPWVSRHFRCTPSLTMGRRSRNSVFCGCANFLTISSTVPFSAFQLIPLFTLLCTSLSRSTLSLVSISSQLALVLSILCFQSFSSTFVCAASVLRLHRRRWLDLLYLVPARKSLGARFSAGMQQLWWDFFFISLFSPGDLFSWGRGFGFEIRFRSSFCESSSFFWFSFKKSMVWVLMCWTSTCFSHIFTSKLSSESVDSSSEEDVIVGGKEEMVVLFFDSSSQGMTVGFSSDSDSFADRSCMKLLTELGQVMLSWRSVSSDGFLFRFVFGLFCILVPRRVRFMPMYGCGGEMCWR